MESWKCKQLAWVSFILSEITKKNLFVKYIFYFIRIQFRILKRGLELLNVGGRLVYSTCSFNPVENEAVVQRMMTEAQGNFT